MPLPSKFAIQLGRFVAAGANAASNAVNGVSTASVATVGGVVGGTVDGAFAGQSLGAGAGTASAGASSGASAGAGSGGGTSGSWYGSYQHLLAQGPTVQNVPSNALAEPDDTETEQLRLRSRLVARQPRSLVGHPKGNLQHAPETRKLLNASNAQVQERLARLFANLHSAGPRLIEPSAGGKRPASRPSRSSSSSLPQHTVRRSAAVEQLLYAVARESPSSSRRRATTRPRASSLGARVPSRGYASVAPKSPLPPDETPYTHARDRRAEAALRRLDRDESAALVTRIAAALDDRPAPEVSRPQGIEDGPSSCGGNAALATEIPLLHQLSNQKQYTALLQITAKKGDARAALEVLSLMQRNPSLPEGSLTPKAFLLVLHSLFKGKLLRPKELNVDPRKPLSQHTIASLSVDDAWKKDAIKVMQDVFDTASVHWSLEDPPRQAKVPDTRAARAFVDTSDGVFRTSESHGHLLDAWNGLIHTHFLVGHPEGAVALFRRMVKAQIDDPVPTMALCTPPPTRETVSIMLVGLAATLGASTATEWYNALLSAEDAAPLPSFTGLISLANMYVRSAVGEASPALWDQGRDSGAYSRLLQAIVRDLRGKHQHPDDLLFDLMEALVSPGVVAKMDERQLQPLLMLLGTSLASPLPPGHNQPLGRTTQFGSSLLFLADKCMRYHRAADAASVLTYVLRWTTLSSEAVLGGSPNEYRLKTATQWRKVSAVGKRIIHLIGFTQRMPREHASPAAAALLATALTAFTPILKLYPSLLQGVQAKKQAIPQADLWAARITALYRQTVLRDREAMCERFSADEWTVLIQAFAHEEQALEPDQARMVSSGLGMVAEDYARSAPAMAEGAHLVRPANVRPARKGHFVRPEVEQAAEVLLARYPQNDVISVLEKINPAYLRMLRTKPWDPEATVEPETAQALARAKALPQMSVRAQKAFGPVQPSESVSSDPHLGFAPVLELSDELGREAYETLNSTTTSKVNGVDVRVQRTWDLLLSSARQGVYPTPAFLAGLINMAGVRRDMQHVRLLYLMASHVVRSLEGIAQASAWVAVENAMICAAACLGECRLANSHRHLLVNAGQVPSADAYGSLIAASKVTTDEVFVSRELFDEAINLGVKPNLYLFNTIISTFSRARRADTALAYYKMMLSYNIQPSSITYGALINAFTRRGEINQALHFFELMEALPDFRPSAAPFNTLISHYVQKGDRASALELISKMRTHRLSFSGYTWKLLLDAYGLIEPVDEAKLLETFNRIAAFKAVEGTHLATLITSYGINGNDLEKAQGIYASITPRSGRRYGEPLPDAVCHQAMMEVFVHHKRLDLLFDFIKRLSSTGTRFTAYHANVTIRAYGQYGGRGLAEARRVFAAMRDPPTGVAAIGNHASRADGKGNKKDALKLPSYYASLLPGEMDATATAASAAVSDSPPVWSAASENLSASPWQGTFREPSTYIAMIQAELRSSHLEPAQWLFQRMYERAFPAPILAQVRTLLDDYRKFGPNAVSTHPLLQSSKTRPATNHRTSSTNTATRSSPAPRTSPASRA